MSYDFKRKKSLIAVLCLIISTVIVTVLFVPIRTLKKDAFAKDDVVKVGYYENEVFQEGASEDAVKNGYAYEYYRKLSEYTGWKYEYVYGEYGELYQKLLDGEIDLLAGLAWKEERKGLIGYPDAAMGNETYNLVKHSEDSDITAEPKTLTGKKIGVLDSAMVGVLDEYLNSRDVKANVITYSGYETLFAAFDNHEIDVLAAEGDGAYGRENTEVIGSFGSSEYYLCVSIKRPDLLKELNMAQAQLSVDEPDYINTLRTKYYPVSVSGMAFSTAEQEWLNTHDSLCVGYLKNYLPYCDTDKNGNVTGLLKDVIPKILSGLGREDIKVTYKGYESYDEMIDDVNAGIIDVAFPVGGGLYYSEENGIYQSKPVITSATNLVYRGDFDDDKVKSFAVNKNNRMQFYYVKTYYPDSEIIFYSSTDECLEAVKNNEVGCTTLNGMRANDILKNSKYRKLSFIQSNHSDERCFGVKIGNEGLNKLINRGINIMGDDYAINIAYKYTDALYKHTVMDVIKDNIWLFLFIIIVFASIVIIFVIRDSNKTKKNQKALSEALVEAENANRAKTIFLNNMSHDIRTPMNAIVGFTGLAVSHIDNKEKVRDYLGKITVSSQHLLSLINDVLDMSRIESGKVKIENSDVNLLELINDLEKMVYADIAAKKQKFEISIEGIKNEWVMTDKLRLNQVLLNIVSNAIKFTPENGIINLSVMEKESHTEGYADFIFRIKDNGIGMSKEFQKTIFDAFTREQSSTVSGIQGTGLGMSITKNIIDMMGGTISVNSKEGEGTEFIVELGFCIGSKKEATLVVESEDGDLGEKSADEADFSGKSVLLVEDNEMNRLIAIEILKSFGLKIDIAIDGIEAVEKIKAEPADKYDVILMDIQMPRMDGYEAAREIRNLDDRKKSSIPIVAVTANVFEEDKKNAIEVGMNGHLAKPYDIPKMIETLNRLFYKKDVV